MNRALPILSLCVALLALAAALVPREPVVVAPLPLEPARPPEPDAELRRRVAQLEEDNRRLWERVALLERRGGEAMLDAGVRTAPSVGELLTGEANRTALKELLREAETERQRERMMEQQLQRQQHASDLRVKWRDFPGTAKLTWAQEQELNKHLDAEDAARRAITEQLQAGGPAPDATRALREVRRETDQAMNKVLDDTQREQFQQLRREGRPGADQLR